MDVFHGTISELSNMEIKEIANILYKKKHPKKRIDVTDREYQSWLDTLPKLFKAILEAGIDNTEIFLEYPLANGYIDAILVGYDHDYNNRVLLFENKGWKEILDCDNNNVETEWDKHLRHPLKQINGYFSKLKYIDAFRDNKIEITGIAFMYNMDDFYTSQLISSYYKVEEINNKHKSAMFNLSDYDSIMLNSYLSNCFNNTKNLKLVHSIENACPVTPIDSLKRAINNNLNIDPHGDQKPAIDLMKQRINYRITHNYHKDEMIVISGAAGTGKTILGYKILNQYANSMEKHNIGENIEKELVYSLYKNGALDKFISNDNNVPVPYVNSLNNYNDARIIVIDEAHRIDNVDTVMNNYIFYNDVNRKPRIVVILQDDWQAISAEDQGIYKNFHDYAIKNNIQFNHVTLNKQIRMGNNNNWNEVIDDMFINSPKRPIHKLVNYKIDVDESLKSIENKMDDLSTDTRGKIKWIAPFCWYWGQGIKITDKYRDTFNHKWNPKPDNQVEWINKYEKVGDKVSCIYTIQGVDLNYSAFIWWNDLYWDNNKNKWMFDITQSKDKKQFIEPAIKEFLSEQDREKLSYEQQLCKLNSNQNPKLLRLFFNVYKVLLTRARKEMFIWFKNESTEKHVKMFINNDYAIQNIK